MRRSTASRCSASSLGRLLSDMTMRDPGLIQQTHHSITDAQFADIGRVVVLTAACESLMVEVVRHALSIPLALADDMLGTTKAEARSTVFIGIIRHAAKDQEVIELAEDCIEAMASLGGERNTLVHGLCRLVEPVPRKGFAVAFRRSKNPRKITFAHTISDTISRLEAVSSALVWLQWFLTDFVPPSQFPWRDRVQRRRRMGLGQPGTNPKSRQGAEQRQPPTSHPKPHSP